MKLKLFFICFFLFFVGSACDLPEEKTETKDNINLAYAIAFKAGECGNHPSYPLYVASGSAMPAKRDMQACALTIINQSCPFEHYPFYCLKLFKNFDIDLGIDFKFKNPFESDEEKNLINQ